MKFETKHWIFTGLAIVGAIVVYNKWIKPKVVTPLTGTSNASGQPKGTVWCELSQSYIPSGTNCLDYARKR